MDTEFTRVPIIKVGGILEPNNAIHLGISLPELLEDILKGAFTFSLKFFFSISGNFDKRFDFAFEFAQCSLVYEWYESGRVFVSLDGS
jgi:hypothetical protein